jgi:hypothetical protein
MFALFVCLKKTHISTCRFFCATQRLNLIAIEDVVTKNEKEWH